MTRIAPRDLGWAESIARPDAAQPRGSGPLAGAGRDIGDGVDQARADSDGADASAAVSGRGRSAERARVLARALVRADDEIAPFRGDFGEFTSALQSAQRACHGELQQVLDEILALRDEVAVGIARISSG